MHRGWLVLIGATVVALAACGTRVPDDGFDPLLNTNGDASDPEAASPDVVLGGAGDLPAVEDDPSSAVADPASGAAAREGTAGGGGGATGA